MSVCVSLSVCEHVCRTTCQFFCAWYPWPWLGPSQCSRIRSLRFFQIKKTWLFTFFFEMTCQNVVRRSLALNHLKWVHILRLVIFVIHQALWLIFPNIWLLKVKFWLLTSLHNKMFDVGDLPVLTFGNCVLKIGVIKWPLKLCTLLNVFFKSKTGLFYVFWVVAHVFSKLVLLWRHCDVLCTSTFMNNVLFEHDGQE